MTPAETYAQSRLEAEKLIRQHAPARLQEAVIERLLPAIVLKSKVSRDLSHDPKIPVGTSKFGGAPDVAEGFRWPVIEPGQSPYGNDEATQPKRLEFLAQINLQEIAACDVDKVLPDTGLLLFFFEIGPRACRVIHVDGMLRRAELPQVWGLQRQQVVTIATRCVWSVPLFAYWSDDPQDDILEWDQDEEERWWQMVRRLDPLLWPHSMLGNPQQIRPDRTGEARQSVVYNTKRGRPEDWQLLLQWGEDHSSKYGFGDYMYLFYFIHRDDLAARDFSKCHLVHERQF